MAGDTANTGWDDRTIGRRVRMIRLARRKSLRVVAGLAGISAGQLSKIENGHVALDRRSVIVALAGALQVSPSELTALPVPAPADGTSDNAISAIRRVLIAVGMGQPGGQVRPAALLQRRTRAIENADYPRRGIELPGLIADLHTTIADGRELAELLPLAVTLHAVTGPATLAVLGAPADLRWQSCMWARQAAEELDDPSMLGVVAWGTAVTILSGGAFDLARDALDATPAVPTNTDEGLQLNGMLALIRSLVAAADNRPAETAAALEHAQILAERTGQGTAYDLGFGPLNVGLWRMASALEAGDPDTAVKVAQRLQPAQHPYLERRAAYWVDYGRALARVRRRDDAVRALRRGEHLFPMRALRNPFVRETLAELVPWSKQDAIGRELRGMAFRAGLPV